MIASTVGAHDDYNGSPFPQGLGRSFFVQPANLGCWPIMTINTNTDFFIRNLFAFGTVIWNGYWGK
jgi:hypothetical protein